jgi:hypothetical protein
MNGKRETNNVNDGLRLPLDELSAGVFGKTGLVTRL